MNLCPLLSIIASISLCFLMTCTAGSDSPTADFSINCGSIGSSPARNGREWVGDVQAKLSSLLQIKGLSTTSTLTSADPVPHKTARLSRSQFSYAFQVSPGQKIIRLHFNPALYKGFKGLKDLFTVEAGPFTLLSNFSPSLTAYALGVNSFAKEFCLVLQENQHFFNIVFSPASSQSQDSTYAFINGIEIISVPTRLSYFYDGDIGVQVVGDKSLVYVDHNTALEVIHRSEVKQNTVPFVGDFDDMFPLETKNNSWKMPVDAGFRYLIRLHFSELGLKIAGTGGLMFEVLINDMIAQTNLDIVKGRDKYNIQLYRDYMVMMRGHKKEDKRDLLISLHSYDEFIVGNGLVSGFEIFKLSNPDNSLATPNASPPAQHSPSHTIQTLLLLLGDRNAIATVVIAIFSLVNIVAHKFREIWEVSNTEEENKPSARAERLCRCFSLTEIQLATRNFSDALLIGTGGFGQVYRGLIDKGPKTVAVKRLKSNSSQGAHEFLTEIETLSELQHVNLVSLIGYCNEHGEMILVYDYMAGGTLAEHLYKLPRESNNSCSLNWKQRLDICIGAGRGLDYLHTGPGVIHRDVKASNILLDENFVAKVSDFGLARSEDKNKLQSHVSTKVKGTRRYLDPYYYCTSKLSRKSDTYSFGVVLLEVVCGRPAFDSRLIEDERILSEWARYKISEGEVDQIVDSRLREEISVASLKSFVEIAERCLHYEPRNRPTMSQVVQQLEFALDQHENKQLLELNEIGSASNAVGHETEQVLVLGASDDIHHCNDEINQSGQPTMASTDVLEITSYQEEQRNIKVVSLPKHRRIATMNKPSRLWPWDALWNKVKKFKKNQFLLSETRKGVSAEGIELTKFGWDIILDGTDQFSSSNIVGRGALGPVYKAVLPPAGGQLVAVKSFSRSSTQGLLAFRNEILLLRELGHQNIIKLLGYCIHGETMLLVYEFMANTSLDSLFGMHGCGLDWSERFKIIMGIAQGVVYLHQDSVPRVIHRDLKPSSILLDVEMNPRISNFASARTMLEHQSELVSEMEISVITGTIGYISPEYLQRGKFSVKSDVYSFGIIVLEMVTGRVQSSDSRMSLVGYAWKVWNEGTPLELVDESILGAFSADEVLRCIQIGLLCTQLEPNHRPSMHSVLKILEGEEPQVELKVEPRPPREDYMYTD